MNNTPRILAAFLALILTVGPSGVSSGAPSTFRQVEARQSTTERALQVGLEEDPDEIAFSQSLHRILETSPRTKFASRQWADLLDPFLVFFRVDMQGAHGSQTPTLSRRARQLGFAAFNGYRRNVQVPAVAAINDLFHESKFYGPRESAGHKAKDIAADKVAEALDLRERFPYPLELIHQVFAAIVARILEGLRATAQFGEPTQPEPPNGLLPHEELIRRIRQELIYANAQSHYQHAPLFDLSRLAAEEGVQAVEGNDSALAVKRLLAYRQLGLVPQEDSLDVCLALVMSFPVRVQFIPPLGENGVPVLRIYSRLPFDHPLTGAKRRVFDLVILKKPLPKDPAHSGSFASMTDDRFVEATASSMAGEWLQVERDAGIVGGLAFENTEPWNVKVKKVLSLGELTDQNRLLIGTVYGLSKEPDGINRLACTFGRTPAERWATQKDFELEFGLISIPLHPKPEPAVPKIKEDPGRRIGDWESAITFLYQIGAAERAPDPEVLERALSLRGDKKDFIELREVFGPLLCVLCAHDSSGQMVLSDQDARTLASRMREKFWKELLAIQDTSRKLLGGQPIVHPVLSPQGQLCLAALNESVLRSVPSKPGKPFRDGSMKAVVDRLRALSVQQLGSHAKYVPQGSTGVPPELQAAQDSVIEAQARLRTFFAADLQTATADQMHQTLQALETTLARLRDLSQPVPQLNVKPLPLSGKPEVLEQSVNDLYQAAGAAISQAGSPSSTVGENVPVELYRAWVELRRLVEQGQLQTALAQSVVPMPEILPAEHQALLQTFRQQVAQRIADNALGQIEERVTAPGADLENVAVFLDGVADGIKDFKTPYRTLKVKAGEIRRQILGAQPEAASVQQRAREFLIRYVSELKSQRLIRARVERIAEGQPAGEEKLDKIRGQIVRETAQGGITDFYRDLFEIDPALNTHSGLEEQLNQAAAVFREAAQGTGLIAIDANVFARQAGLEDLLRKIPVGGRFVIIGAGSVSAMEIVAENPSIQWAQTVEDAVPLILSLPTADQVHVLGSLMFLHALQNDLVRFAVEVSPLDLRLGLKVIFLSIGISEDVLRQIDWSSTESALTSLEAA